MTSEALNPDISQTPNRNIRPWVRFFARHIDIYIFAIIFGFFWGFLAPNHPPKSDIVFGMLALFLWALVEPFFLTLFGATFGKWLLNIKVRDSDDKKLDFLVALKRSLLVWLKGIAIGIPIVCLFTFIAAYSDLTKRGITSWDKSCHVTITHQKIGTVRIVFAFLFLGLFIAAIILGTKI